MIARHLQFIVIAARQRQMWLRLDICKQEEEKEEVADEDCNSTFASYDADAADVLHYLLMEWFTIGAGLI